MAIICGKKAILKEDLESSFYGYIDKFEAEALRKCMSNQDEKLSKEVIIPLFSRCCIFSIPSSSTLPEMVKKAAYYCFLAKPYYALSEIRRGILSYGGVVQTHA